MIFERSPNSLTKYYFTSQKITKKKQSEAATEMLYKNVVLENFAKFSGKRSCRSLFLILLYRCFPVNIMKF